jgi:hypothetical protein
MIRKIFFYLLTVMTATSTISCSDDNIESTVDSKTMPFDTYSSTTRANDDFYEYCHVHCTSLPQLHLAITTTPLKKQ